MTSEIFFYIYIIIIITASIELFLITSFNNNYFRSGFTIFKKTYVIETNKKNLTYLLNNSFPSILSSFSSKIYFHQIDNNNYALRQKLMSSSFPTFHSVMHCYINMDSTKQKFIIYGKMNFYILEVVILFTLIIILPIFYIVDRLILSFIGLLILSFLYYLQKQKFLSLGRFINTRTSDG